MQRTVATRSGTSSAAPFPRFDALGVTDPTDGENAPKREAIAHVGDDVGAKCGAEPVPEIDQLRGHAAPGSSDVRNRWVFGSAAEKFADRFLSKVDSSAGPDACWPWKGARSRKGYGQFHPVLGVHTPAHRFALILKLGRDLGPAEVAMHLCHNPPCCNPDHLIAGSQSQNMRHSSADGRAYRGELNVSARFSDDAVMELRRLAAVEYRRGWFALQARRMGTTVVQVARMVRGELWGHLPGAVDVGNASRGKTHPGSAVCWRGHSKIVRSGRLVCKPCQAEKMRSRRASARQSIQAVEAVSQ